MADSYNVGDLVAEFLSAIGVETVFGIVSVHNVPMMDAIGRRNAIRYVMTRGEMGASHMADGYARASGGLGVLITSTGPGAANAVAGLVEAQFAGTPLLHLTGQTQTQYVDRGLGTVHDVPDQLGMLRAVGKGAFRVRSAGQALGTLMEAATLALTPRQGPVSVEIPIDIQRTQIERPAQLDRLVLPVPAPLAPDEAALDDLAERVAKAKRPMLWLGNGARGAGAPARALLDMGFCMLTSWAGRGAVPEDHPQTLGALNGTGVAEIEDFYGRCDLMLVAGCSLRGHETREFILKMPKNLVQIDIDPRVFGRAYPARLFVGGDARLVLEGLARRLAGRLAVEPGYTAEFTAMAARVRAALKDTLGPYATFPEQLRAVMPRDALFVRDITISNTTWGHRLFPVYGPRDSIYPVGAGIGVGMHLGVGAALGAKGRRVVMMTGDGGFFLNMTELWTAVQDRADLVMVVMNDRGYGVIKMIQDALYGGRRFFGDLHAPDLQQLGALAGIPAFKVTEADGFGPAVAQALAHRGPSLVEVDMTAIGAFPPFFPYNRKT
jgi:acetolactate synthase-1/2/3 large subunit